MKRAFGALLALVCAILSAPAFAAPPTFTLDSPPPPGAAILYCVNTASGPPYIAYPCDATHPVQTSGGGGGAITGNVGVLNTGSTQIDPATSGKQDTGNTSLSAIATSTAAGSTAANQAAIQAPIAPATGTATKAVAIGCQYNSTTITPTDGQQFIIQCGPRGGLNVGGSVASGAADGGNPVKTGGVYNSSPITVTTGQRADTQVDAHGAAKTICVDSTGTACDYTTNLNFAPYPGGATPITGPGTGSTGAVVGTLAGTTGKTTYICGVDVSAIGGTAAIGPVVVAGLKGGSFTYQLTSTATGVQLQKTYTPCIPASAVNTAITVTTTADGTATAVDVNPWGFQL